MSFKIKGFIFAAGILGLAVTSCGRSTQSSSPSSSNSAPSTPSGIYYNAGTTYPGSTVIANETWIYGKQLQNNRMYVCDVILNTTTHAVIAHQENEYSYTLQSNNSTVSATGISTTHTFTMPYDAVANTLTIIDTTDVPGSTINVVHKFLPAGINDANIQTMNSKAYGCRFQ